MRRSPRASSRPATAPTTGRSRILLSGIGTIGTALNIVATTLCMRCPGMKLSRMPLLVWLYLVMCGLVFVTISPLTAAQIMLLLDRYLGAHFFDTQAGGSAVLWMHFFWIFGHPEVYVLVLPAFAFANEIIPVFSRKAIFGYPAMVAASVGIGFISLSVWAHHMFTVGMTSGANTFFVLATMAISVPTGIKIFNWLATLWGGKIHFTASMMFAIGFLFQFLIAGLTGIMLSVAPFDWQLGSSYFVVAHFHYVLVGAILFMLFSAFYYWYPEDDRPHVERKARQVALLALPHRLPPHLRLHAHPRHGGHAAPHLHLRGRSRLDDAEHDRLQRRRLSGRRHAALRLQHGLVVLQRPHRRPRSLGCVDAGVVHRLAAAGYNFAVTPTVESRRPLWDLKHPDDPDSHYE